MDDNLKKLVQNRICDDAFTSVKQFVLQNYDMICPFAIVQVSWLQLRILLDLWELLPETDTAMLAQRATDKIMCETTNEYVYNYEEKYSYRVMTHVYKDYGDLLAETTIYFLDRRDLNPIQERWVQEEWKRQSRNDKTDAAFKANWEVYKSHKEELIKDHLNEWAVIAFGKIQKIAETYNDVWGVARNAPQRFIFKIAKDRPTERA